MTIREVIGLLGFLALKDHKRIALSRAQGWIGVQGCFYGLKLKGTRMV